MKLLVASAFCLCAGIAGAQSIMNMGQINEMCGPKDGHREWVDHMECVLTVLPRSNNPDLLPANPYIGWYTSMAQKMIDDVKSKRISEGDAKEHVQQAYHEVLVRQQQAAADDIEQESVERRRLAALRAQEQAATNQQQAIYDEQNAEIDQARLDRYCAGAAKSVDDTCSVQTKNPKVGAGLCAAAKILYLQQGCR